jgi:hypothetical protein
MGLYIVSIVSPDPEEVQMTTLSASLLIFLTVTSSVTVTADGRKTQRSVVRCTVETTYVPAPLMVYTLPPLTVADVVNEYMANTETTETETAEPLEAGLATLKV